jgi:hypothetical protein
MVSLVISSSGAAETRTGASALKNHHQLTSMPILIFQLATRPILLTMALVNVVLLAVCGYLLLVPAGGAALVASFLSEDHVPAGDSLGVSTSTTPKQTEWVGSIRPVRGHSMVSSPSSKAGIAATEATEVQPSSPVDPMPNHSEDHTFGPLFAGARYNAASFVAGLSPQPAFFSQTVARSTSFSPVDAYVNGPATATTLDATIPLAYTTSADNATPSQAAALDRLQKDFADALAAQGQSPDDPAYARAWRSAQIVSDSNFEQQFGSQAFIQAQLAQVHGGAN